MSTHPSKRRFKGQRFGLIELLEKRELRGKNHLWLVKCHGCDKQYVRSSSFKKGTYSCGCKKSKPNNQSPHWKGYGSLSSQIFTHYKVNAKRRGIDFNISIIEMWELFEKQNGLCALSGIPIKFGSRGKDENTASLDRINSKLPYVVWNVQWVHKHINMMKLNHDQTYFIHLCKLIANKK